MALELAGSDPFPATLGRPCFLWVRLAVLLLLAPRRAQGVGVHREKTQAISKARDLYENPEVRPLVQAALLTRNATADSVASALGLEPLVVEAFDALFFNVLARKSELAYLRQIVRPAKDEHDLLKAGLNGTLNDVLHAAGCGGLASGDSTSNLIQKMRNDMLAAGAAWFSQGAQKAPTAVAAQAMALVQKSTDEITPDPELGQTGVFAEMLAAQLDRDRQVIRHDALVKAGLIEAAPNAKSPAA